MGAVRGGGRGVLNGVRLPGPCVGWDGVAGATRGVGGEGALRRTGKSAGAGQGEERGWGGGGRCAWHKPPALKHLNSCACATPLYAAAACACGCSRAL